MTEIYNSAFSVMVVPFGIARGFWYVRKTTHAGSIEVLALEQLFIH